MTDNTQPEALRLADDIKASGQFTNLHTLDEASAELRRQHTRIAELESELEAVGAGGVQALSAAPAIGDELRDTLVAVSAAIAERDDRAAQKMICEILAASTTPPAEQQATKETSGGFHVWRDISTAPKDGSRFVATGHNYGLYSEVRHTCVAQWFRGCWMEASDWNETSELKYLTHWMPLPSPPDDVAAPAEQQAQPDECFPGEPKVAVPQGLISAACFAIRNKRDGGKVLEQLRRYSVGDLSQPLAPQQEAQEPSKAYAWVYVNKYGVDSIPASKDWCTAMVSGHGGSMFPLYTAPQPAPAELERLRERIARMGLDVDRAMRGHVNEQSPLGTQRLAAIAALVKPKPAPPSDDVVKDAARWRMAALIGNEVMLHPDKRTHATAVKAYMDATHSGSDLTGAVDAALAAQGGKA